MILDEYKPILSFRKLEVVEEVEEEVEEEVGEIACGSGIQGIWIRGGIAWS
jgi:hypothetical protein